MSEEMKNYIKEIEEVHPYIENQHQWINAKGNQVDLVQHYSGRYNESFSIDYDYFINGKHQDGGRLEKETFEGILQLVEQEANQK